MRWASKFAFSLVFLFVAVLFFFIVSANTYVPDLSFTLQNGVYSTGARIELSGTLTARIYNSTSNISTTTFVTDNLGIFFSKSDYNSTAPLINAPNNSGDYGIRATYK